MITSQGLESVLAVSIILKLKKDITYDPAIPVLGIYWTNAYISYVHQKICTRMFITALFITASNKKLQKNINSWLKCDIFIKRNTI